MADDDWFTSNAREVRFEPLFDEQIKQLGVDPQWFDDAIVGLDLALAKHPEIFPKAPGTPFSCAKLMVYKNAPPLRAYFTYDATTGEGHLCEVYRMRDFNLAPLLRSHERRTTRVVRNGLPTNEF